MQLTQHTIPELLPCPLCGSQLVLPVLRCATNCDVKLKLYHCNHCGMEAPQHTWASWARPAGALNDNRGERLAPARGSVSVPYRDLLALLERWTNEWDKWLLEQGQIPLNHRARRISEGMCNTLMMCIRDFQKLLTAHGPSNERQPTPNVRTHLRGE